VERNATPPPPPYAAILESWSPRELFWIIKHGIKMTAMPPWPTQERDDEVWAMVAFVRRLPDLDAASYRELSAFTPDERSSPLAALEGSAAKPLPNCVRCHGTDGTSRQGAFPRLAGLSPVYIARALHDFRDGRRPSGFMQAAVSGLTDAEIDRLAAHYGAQGAADAAEPSAEGSATGSVVAHFGTGTGRALPCLSCHAVEARARNPAIPSLAQQDEHYLVEQLRLFRDGRRRNGPMNIVARALGEDELNAVANYFATQVAQ
jgi:cytochrome c553